jgi:zinc transporter ZupT
VSECGALVKVGLKMFAWTAAAVVVLGIAMALAIAWAALSPAKWLVWAVLGLGLLLIAAVVILILRAFNPRLDRIFEEHR